MLIPAGLEENIYHISVLVDSTSEILPLPPDRYEEFIHVPDVAQATLFVPTDVRILGAELPTPLSNGLVGDYNPSLCQQILNISEAQAESMIEPNGMTDDVWRESVSIIVKNVGSH